MCEITDPLYRNQLNGLVTIYSNWTGLLSFNEASRSSVVNTYLSQEHGLATDIVSNITNQEVMIKERWKYEPLTFATPSSTKEWNEINIEVYPNPAFESAKRQY